MTVIFDSIDRKQHIGVTATCRGSTGYPASCGLRADRGVVASEVSAFLVYVMGSWDGGSPPAISVLHCVSKKRAHLETLCNFVKS